MTKFLESLTANDKEKYLKDIKKDIDFETYPKVEEFIQNNELYITNVKTGIIHIKDKNSNLILDSSKNRWFVLCIDSKVCLIAKKNILIHNDMFEYNKRDNTFSKVTHIDKSDYLIEYVENIGANLSLNVPKYEGKIGKEKWDNIDNELSQITLELLKKNPLTGYTYNSDTLSLCNIGKGYENKLSVLK